MSLVWLGWSLLLAGIWGIVYLLLKSQAIRHEMLVVSFSTSLLGFTEPLFVPAYWSPPSLFNLAATTGFDIESLIFSFAIGGLGFALYMTAFSIQEEEPVPYAEIIAARHRYHLPLLFVTPVLFIVLSLFTRFNPIYCAIVALLLGGITTWYCRPDLKRKMIVSAFLFLALYFLYFLTLIIAEPGFVNRVWNLPALSGIFVLGIPVEELLFAFSFGFYWSTVYEHFTWKRIPERGQKSGDSGVLRTGISGQDST